MHPVNDWTSTSLAAPGQLTVSTYQAMHAAADGDSDAGLADWIEPLKALGPATLVLDEAHHLRREWWRALQLLVEAMPDAVIVSLTATPPYDVPLAEWQRYESLCGPIDAEIAIPELVRNGDLCPHQDHVHLSTPTAAETRYLAERRAGLTALFEDLLDDSAFLDALAAHPWLAEPAMHEEAILDDPETLSAMLIALAAEGWPLPRPALQLLGIEGDGTPPLVALLVRKAARRGARRTARCLRRARPASRRDQGRAATASAPSRAGASVSRKPNGWSG